MTINDVLTPKDLQDELILTCVSYPETDVELSFTSLAEENIL
jgi:ferredoxin